MINETVRAYLDRELVSGRELTEKLDELKSVLQQLPDLLVLSVPLEHRAAARAHIQREIDDLLAELDGNLDQFLTENAVAKLN